MGGYSLRGSFMSYGRAYAFSTLAVAIVLALPAYGQSVISTRSGVVHFFEGAVYLGDQPLEPHLGKFPCMPEGAQLRTAQGRAEVLLTPGVFLRMGESSTIRLVANDLADTRVELLAGSAIVDSEEPSSGTSVTLIYKDWKVRFLQKGIYRIDSEPPRLLVRQGEVEVSAGATGTPVSVKQGMGLPFAAVLVPERSIDAPTDSLANWADGRGESIAADNAITAQIDEDPASRTYGIGSDGFAYFPLIGATPLGLGSSSLYSSYTPYQSGFNSIYLPGYTYRPLILGLRLGGYGAYRGYVPSRPWRPGFSSGIGTIVPGSRTPIAPARPVTRGGFHPAHR
jgi:hypothetical protein